MWHFGEFYNAPCKIPESSMRKPSDDPQKMRK